LIVPNSASQASAPDVQGRDGGRSPADPTARCLGALNAEGWVVMEGVVPRERIDESNRAMAVALERRDRIREANGVAGNADGTLHHLLADDRVFVDLLLDLARFDRVARAFLSGNYILNSYGGVINRRDSRAYVHNVHRDIRFASQSRRFMLNCLVMLDDFTLENGATYLLSRSQELGERPDDATFFSKADRATGKAGSVLYFDSRLWHATGENKTERPRRALTLTFTSPFFKPQLDYPRLVGYDAAQAMSPFLRQVIGFNARIPATLEEYYVPVEQRFYQRGQDE
jgi:ectoine hydroxylase-related dioxygenase (phytanoyl-CoA dioxygenase family)